MSEPSVLPPALPRPCSECPWVRGCARGWLGGFEAEQWLRLVHSDEVVACHETIKVDGSMEGARQCTGAATFRANVFKLPRNPEVARGERDVETVFENDAEFAAHHDIGLG